MANVSQTSSAAPAGTPLSPEDFRYPDKHAFLLKQYIRLEGDFEELRIAADRLAKEKDLLISSQKQLQRENASLKEARRADNAQQHPAPNVLTLQREISELQIGKQKIQKSYTDAANEVVQLRKDLDETTAKLRSEAEEAHRLRSAHGSDINGVRNELQKANGLTDRLREENQVLQDQAAALHMRMRELETRIEEDHRMEAEDMEAKDHNMSLLQNNLDELEYELGLLQEKNAALLHDNRSLRETGIFVSREALEKEKQMKGELEMAKKESMAMKSASVSFLITPLDSISQL